MSIEDLINNVKVGDAAKSNNTFNNVMATKMNAALDAKKQEIAQSMYGVQETETPVEEPVADDAV